MSLIFRSTFTCEAFSKSQEVPEKPSKKWWLHICLSLGFSRSRLWGKDLSVSSSFGRGKEHQDEHGKWCKEGKPPIRSTLVSKIQGTAGTKLCCNSGKYCNANTSDISHLRLNGAGTFVAPFLIRYHLRGLSEGVN